MIPDNARVDVVNGSSIVKPYALGHGTVECRDLKASRRFYEEFLGLECVRHAQPAMAVRCGMKFHVFAVEVGDDLHPTNLLNHWGIDVASREAVDQAHADALANRETYGIREVRDVVVQHGVYSFFLEDLDHNWWEIQHYEGFQHDDLFEFGDRF